MEGEGLVEWERWGGWMGIGMGEMGNIVESE